MNLVLNDEAIINPSFLYGNTMATLNVKMDPKNEAIFHQWISLRATEMKRVQTRTWTCQKDVAHRKNISQ